MPLPPNTRTAPDMLRQAEMPEERIPLALQVIENVRHIRTKPPPNMTLADIDALVPAGTSISFLSCGNGFLYPDEGDVRERYDLDFVVTERRQQHSSREFTVEIRFRGNNLIGATIKSPMIGRRITITAA